MMFKKSGHTKKRPEASRSVKSHPEAPPASPSAPKTRLTISCRTTAGTSTLSSNRRRTVCLITASCLGYVVCKQQ